MDIHRVADHEGRALVAAQHAGRERPGDLEVAHIVLVDLVQLGIALVGVVARLDRPLSGVVDLGLEIVVRLRRCRGTKHDP